MEEILSDIWLYVLLIVLPAIAYWYVSVPKHLPPGTAGVPLLGYLPFMNKYAHLTFQKLGRRYGNVFHLYLGNRLIVVLNDHKAIREAFIKHGDIFAGRPGTVNRDQLGIVSNDGEYWYQHRRFIMNNLRDYASSMESLMLNELQICINDIKNKNGESFLIRPLITASIANNIHMIVTGKRYDFDRPIMKQLLRRGAISVPFLNLAFYLPWLTKLPGSEKIIRRKPITQLYEEFRKAVEAIVEKAKDEYVSGQKDTYINAYMTEMNERLKLDGVEKYFTDAGLLNITNDLLVTGTESLSAIVRWSLFYMTKYTEIQQRVQSEIDQVIGREREPSYNDRVNMPYTEATIMELQRILSLVPLSVTHRNTKDVVIFGHTIPKDTMIIPNLWAVHHDPSVWEDPENFKPERFIGPDGQVIKSDYLIPFSIGKRACAGEAMAKMEVFLYFVSLLQHFNFVPPDGVMPDLEANPGLGLRPKSQLVCAKLR